MNAKVLFETVKKNFNDGMESLADTLKEANSLDSRAQKNDISVVEYIRKKLDLYEGAIQVAQKMRESMLDCEKVFEGLKTQVYFALKTVYVNK
jgi:hypothetical protein